MNAALLMIKGLMQELPQERRSVVEETISALKEVVLKTEEQHPGLGLLALGYVAIEAQGDD